MGIKKVPAITFLIAIVVIILSFQNCGQLASQGKNSSQGNSESNVPNGDGAFKAGDPFDAEKIPYALNDPQFEQKLKNYSAAEGFKAVAVAKNGVGSAAWISKDKLVKSQEEWSRVVLERCELQAREPCALFAEGNEIKYDESQFLEMDELHIETPQKMDGSKIPGLIDHWRNFEVTNYLPIPEGRFRAYAIGLNGNTSSGVE